MFVIKLSAQYSLIDLKNSHKREKAVSYNYFELNLYLTFSMYKKYSLFPRFLSLTLRKK